jgi:hypothetical protein
MNAFDTVTTQMEPELPRLGQVQGKARTSYQRSRHIDH